MPINFAFALFSPLLLKDFQVLSVIFFSQLNTYFSWYEFCLIRLWQHLYHASELLLQTQASIVPSFAKQGFAHNNKSILSHVPKVPWRRYCEFAFASFSFVWTALRGACEDFGADLNCWRVCGWDQLGAVHRCLCCTHLCLSLALVKNSCKAQISFSWISWLRKLL